MGKREREGKRETEISFRGYLVMRTKKKCSMIILRLLSTIFFAKFTIKNRVSQAQRVTAIIQLRVTF